MNLLWTLKILCDSCFYFTFAVFIGAGLGGESVISAIPFMGISLYLSVALIKRKFVKFIPVLLFGMSFYFIEFNKADMIIMLPVFLYMLYSVYNGFGGGSNLYYKNIFSIFIRALAVLLIIGLVVARGALEQALPFALIFLACAVLLMRMLRYDSKMLNENRLKIINFLTVSGVLALGFAFSSKIFLDFLKSALHLIYFNIIMPVLYALISLFAYLVGGLFILLARFSNGNISEPSDIEPAVMDNFFNPDVIAVNPYADILRTIGITIFALAAAYAVYRLFKALSRNKFNGVSESGVFIERTSIEYHKSGRKFFAGTGNQIREIYRKFMEACGERGINLLHSDTSEDIARKSSFAFENKEDSKRLREIYIGVRYSDIPATKNDIKECKHIYSEFKKNVKNS